MRYRVAQARREWNRLAKPPWKIWPSKDGAEAFRVLCRMWHENTGKREVELPSYAATDHVTHIIEF